MPYDTAALLQDIDPTYKSLLRSAGLEHSTVLMTQRTVFKLSGPFYPKVSRIRGRTGVLLMMNFRRYINRFNQTIERSVPAMVLK